MVHRNGKISVQTNKDTDQEKTVLPHYYPAMLLPLQGCNLVVYLHHKNPGDRKIGSGV